MAYSNFHILNGCWKLYGNRDINLVQNALWLDWPYKQSFFVCRVIQSGILIYSVWFRNHSYILGGLAGLQCRPILWKVVPIINSIMVVTIAHRSLNREHAYLRVDLYGWLYKFKIGSCNLTIWFILYPEVPLVGDPRRQMRPSWGCCSSSHEAEIPKSIKYNKRCW
jgi:hypothetical protein